MEFLLGAAVFMLGTFVGAVIKSMPQSKTNSFDHPPRDYK